MSALRTPLEVALGERLPLDFTDLDLEDLDAADAANESRELDALSAAIAAGEYLVGGAL